MKWTLALEWTLSLGNVEVFKYEGKGIIDYKTLSYS